MTKKQTSKKSKKKKKIKKSKKDIIIICIELFLIFIMIISIYKIVFWFNDNSKSKKMIEEVKKDIEKPKEDNTQDEYKIDFDSLKQKNNDIVAYIKINGINIEYPLVKTDNNSYYLNHSLDKTYSEAGWPFINSENNLDGSDKNISMFGHARLDGSMFGTLKETLSSPWQDNPDNFIITFITETGSFKYQVFSTYKIKVEDYYLQSTFQNDEEFEEFINIMASRSNKDYGIEVNRNDQIITLSTCDLNNDYRIVLHAKKI